METLNNPTIVTTDAGNQQTTSASVVVSSTNPPTTVSTGLTDNFLFGSLFLPLILAIVGVWLYRSGLFGMVAWYDGRRGIHKDYLAHKKLDKKITTIRQKETA